MSHWCLVFIECCRTCLYIVTELQCDKEAGRKALCFQCVG